ncbi:MAG: bifunctional aspartate kinase/homoserine dehydrogenase I [Planctomycetes bacterium]|nr:bifunctional aspartate kinase/homoserine dehydrogenase I [Planctomycetota bacterium]
MASDEQTPAWVVHKFGGTSLADAEHYLRVAAILAARGDRLQAVVVSAMAGITDRLLGLVDLASNKQPFEAELNQLHQIQHAATRELGNEQLLVELQTDISDIGDILHSTSLIGHAGELVHDRIAGYGELWSARQLAAFLQKQGGNVHFVDTRRFLTTENGEMGPSVHWQTSALRLQQVLAEEGVYDGANSPPGAASSEVANPTTLVMTGFIAADPKGHTTTLGRNGSDYSASIVGKLLQASAINIWTDVDGVMSADPRLVPNAQVLESLSFDEALELAYFGASVLHPQTMMPAIQAQIPVYIRNTFNPDGCATRIGQHSSDGFRIKGISATSGLALINLEGTGMIGVPGTARRVFGAIKRRSISVVMISQANSEHSICFVVRQTDADLTELALREEFARELQDGMVQAILVNANCSILAVVGDAMVGQVGVAAQFFTALAGAGISIRAIAQGSSERNISTVIDSSEVQRAVRTVHAAFYLSPQTLSIGLVGAGKVGAEFLLQLHQEQDRLKAESNIDLRIRAIATSKRMMLSEKNIDLRTWREQLDEVGVAADLSALQVHIKADHIPHAVLVDCTASDMVADLHQQWLGAGIHVMTANKKANAASMESWRQIRRGATAGNARYFYEATVGAGLPVIKVLEDLQETGDHVHSIEGVFSGTLAYLFNSYDGEIAFSELVRRAWKLGYTEPDPREDLSGTDVARKLVILAREMGMELNLEDLQLDSLVPTELENSSASVLQNPVDSIGEFFIGLAQHDVAMQQKFQSARERGMVLRFTGRLHKDGTATVGLSELPDDHSFAHTNLTDNVIQFTTDRYCDNPLVVRGPGAGSAVTAAGVFADLLRLCGDLGAHV